MIGLLTVLNIELSKDKHGNKFPLYRIILNQYPNQPLATSYNQLQQCIPSSIPLIFTCLVAESFLFIYHLLIPLSCSVRSKRRMSWHNSCTFAIVRNWKDVAQNMGTGKMSQPLEVMQTRQDTNTMTVTQSCKFEITFLFPCFNFQIKCIVIKCAIW